MTRDSTSRASSGQDQSLLQGIGTPKLVRLLRDKHGTFTCGLAQHPGTDCPQMQELLRAVLGLWADPVAQLANSATESEPYNPKP